MRLSPAIVAALGLVGCDGCPARETAQVVDEAEPDRLARVAVDPPAAEGAFAPSPTVDGESVMMTWIEPASAGHRVRFSKLGGDAWSPPVTIVSSDRMFANWADFPAVARSGDGSLWAHWARRSGDEPYAYDVVLMRSTDDGARFAEVGPAHDDGTPTEHGFVSYVPTAAGLRIFWLDGRNTGSEGGAMALRSAMVEDGAIAPSVVVDERVCDCCQTAAVATAEGALVAYRDRTETEVRDIARVRLGEAGFSEPASIHRDGWELRGCPVNGPSLDADGSRVAVAWFTGAEPASVKAALSSDSGARFGDPVAIDAEAPIGRADVVLVEGGAIVAWLARGADDETAELRLRRLRERGDPGEPVTVATTSAARASGFPRLSRVGRRLFVTWTDVGAVSRVRAAWIDESAI